MKLKTPRKFSLGIVNTIALAALIFLLPFVFFFSPLAFVRCLKLYTPYYSYEERVSEPPLFLIMTSDKHYYINNSEVPFENIEGVLQKRTDEMRERVIIFRPDTKLSIQDLVDVISIGKKNNIEMVIATPQL